MFHIAAAVVALGFAGGGWSKAEQRRPIGEPVHPSVLAQEHEGESVLPRESETAFDVNEQPSAASGPGTARGEQDAPADGQSDARAIERTQLIMRRAEALAHELELVIEHLEADPDPADEEHIRPNPRLVRFHRQTDAALGATDRLRRLVESGTPAIEVYDEFGALDEHVQGLLQVMGSAEDPTFRNASSRIAYAHERLHTPVATWGGRPPEAIVMRLAVVLAAEFEALERTAKLAIAETDEGAGRDDSRHAHLVAATRSLTEAANQFALTSETERDLRRLTGSFAAVERGWRDIVGLANRSTHTAYFFRQAQRAGAVHVDIRQLLGIQGERHIIRFNARSVWNDVGR